MARKPKVITDFSGMSESDFADAVVTTNNNLELYASDFPSLPVAVSVQVIAIGKYNSIRTSNYYPSQAADLEAQRKIIQTNLKLNGNYVNELANGDLILLEKSGYPLAKAPSKQGVLPPTTLVLNVRDQAGQLDYSITGAIETRITFAIFFTPATNPETNPFKWQFVYCPKRKGILTGLESKQDYKFVSVAMGTDPELNKSAVVVKAAV